MFSTFGAAVSLLLEIIHLIEQCVADENKKEALSKMEDAFRDARANKNTDKLTNVVNSILSNAK